MKRTEVVEEIKKAAHKMRPMVQTILYGSEARGDARPDSDIDLLVLVDKDKQTICIRHSTYLCTRNKLIMISN